VSHEDWMFDGRNRAGLSRESSFAKHIPLRDQMASLERSVSDELKGLGYRVRGAHPKVTTPDPKLLTQVRAIIRRRFKAVRPVNREVTKQHLPQTLGVSKHE